MDVELTEGRAGFLGVFDDGASQEQVMHEPDGRPTMIMAIQVARASPPGRNHAADRARSVARPYAPCSRTAKATKAAR